MKSGRALAIKRINKDMKEILKSPIEGIGIISLDNDPMKYIVNLCLMAGIYEGYCIQLLLTFSDNYPTKPPKILIYPNQGIDGQYHHHIFPDYSKDEDGHHFKKFCFDLLDNDFMSTSTEHSGWNPSYSISSLLLQVQNFIGDPDLPLNRLPNNSEIRELFDSMNKYQRKFKNGDTEIIHTWKNPYPEMYFKKNDKNNNNENKSNEEDNLQIIKENLTCFMLKLNYIDDPDILLGYPIIQKKGLGKDKIELYPIPELLTYDGFMAQIGKNDEKLDYYFNTKFKSANNEYYNYWVPIYIDKNHYLKNKTAILNSFSIIKYGPRGIKEYDFQPEQIFEILPIILNKMIIGMFSGQSSISSSFIRCYFHYVLLFKKLSEEYNTEFVKYLNHKLNLIHKSRYNIKKSIIPDIGNFLVALFFCNRNTHNEKMKKMWYCLFQEFLIRQIYWMFFDNKLIRETLEQIKLEKYKVNFDKEMDLLRKEAEREAFRSGKFIINIEDNEDFIELIKEEKLYDNIVDIFLPGIYDRRYLKDDFIIKMNENFEKVFNQSNDSIKKNLYSLFEKNKLFKNYFTLSDDGKKLLTQIFEHKKKLFIEKNKDERKYALKVDYFIYNYKDNKNILEQFLKLAYNSQRGNKLLLITFFAQKKIEEKGFMEKLEKNYGIYLDVDNFIKEMKRKLDEVKSYNQLFEYIGSEFGRNESDIELIQKAYKEAKLKGYINDYNTSEINIGRERNESMRGRGSRGRGRGRGRGERGRGRGRGRGERGRGRGGRGR